jgi:hypothetical protein
MSRTQQQSEPAAGGFTIFSGKRIACPVCAVTRRKYPGLAALADRLGVKRIALGPDEPLRVETEEEARGVTDKLAKGVAQGWIILCVDEDELPTAAKAAAKVLPYPWGTRGNLPAATVKS